MLETGNFRVEHTYSGEILTQKYDELSPVIMNAAAKMMYDKDANSMSEEELEAKYGNNGTLEKELQRKPCL